MTRIAFAIVVLSTITQTCCLAAQLSVGVQHDLSAPTYGLQGPTSSQITYDDKNGLKLGGTINEIFGPPIKFMTGFNDMIRGSNMAGVGNSLKSGSALLGIDSKLLEAAGGAHLLKGGLLFGGAAAKTGVATAVGGLPGKKISSIIELPVKVIAMKDLAAGKAMAGLGKLKKEEAQASNVKGASMIKEGEQLKMQGMNQMMQGAQEGMLNIGNMVQQMSGNAATAVKLLPIILDLPMGQQPIQQQQQQQQPQQEQQQQLADPTKGGLQHGSSGLTGGSLFGGLSSLFPNLANDPLVGQHSPLANLFNGHYNHNGYAAVLNTTNPLTNLLMQSGQMMNPFLLPLNTLSEGPLGQSLMSKAPAGTNLLGGRTSYDYNLFPGIRMKETMSSQFPNLIQPLNTLQQPLNTLQQVEKTNQHQAEEAPKV